MPDKLPPAGSVTVEELLALPEGAVIVTYGVAWAKTGPDEWRCPYRKHVPDKSISPRWVGFEWHDIRNSAWLAEVATLVVFNPDDWDL